VENGISAVMNISGFPMFVAVVPNAAIAILVRPL